MTSYRSSSKNPPVSNVGKSRNIDPRRLFGNGVPAHRIESYRVPAPAGISIPFGTVPRDVYIQGPRYKVEFYAFETLGGVIGHTGALARADFSTGDTLGFKINVTVEALRTKLQANLARHKDLYQEARDGYCEKAKAQLCEAVDRLKDGKLIRLRFDLEPPTDHSEDYERVLRMLDACTDESMEITEEQFAAYWDDDWSWMYNWVCTNSKMSSKTLAYGQSKGLL